MLSGCPADGHRFPERLAVRPAAAERAATAPRNRGDGVSDALLEGLLHARLRFASSRLERLRLGAGRQLASTGTGSPAH